METSTRKEAFLKGEKMFYTGRQCKEGHLSPRYTSTGSCVACLRQFSKGHRQAVAGTVLLAAQAVHAEDVNEILKTIDFYNARRGLPPAVRPEDFRALPTRWETYLEKEMRKPRGARPSLQTMRGAALAAWGIKEEYATMPGPPVDDWSASVEDIQRMRDARLSQFPSDLDKEGYLDDEKPVDHLPKSV